MKTNILKYLFSTQTHMWVGEMIQKKPGNKTYCIHA